MHQTTTRQPFNPINRFFLTVALAGATLCGGLAYSRITTGMARPNAARMSAAQAARRMLSLCNQYEGPCEIITTPYFQDVTHLAFPPFNLHRKIWQGTLHTNGHIIHMVLNDATGNLGSMYYGGEAAVTSSRQIQETAVTTPLEAARLSLYQLRSLEVVPPHAEVALSGKPEAFHSQEEWWVTWKVRRASGTPPYQVKASLSGKTGRIQLAIDRREMSQHQYVGE